MRWEAAAWSVVSLLSPVIAMRYWPRLRERLPDGLLIGEQVWPWLYGLAPPYLALISGSVVARDLGLRVDGWLHWLLDLLLAGVVVTAIGFAWSRLESEPRTEPGWSVLLDEPRWSLYRAAAGLWVGFTPLALLVGLALALGEWAVRYEVWIEGKRREQRTCLALLRAASSALLYALTRNLWVTIAGQALISWWLNRHTRT